MFIYERVWSNKFNRSFIFSILMAFWAFFIELYFLFWPSDLIKENALLSWLYMDMFGFTFLLDVFHIIVWGICFFFTWLSYAAFKEYSNSGTANISEFVILLTIFAFFVLFLNNIFIATLFTVISAGEFYYMYLALSEQ